MYEPDYEGDMKYYQDQLLAKGITKEMFNMDEIMVEAMKGRGGYENKENC